MKDLNAMLLEVKGHDGYHIWPPAPTMVLYTDANETRWGGILGPYKAQGYWHVRNICVLELWN